MYTGEESSLDHSLSSLSSFLPFSFLFSRSHGLGSIGEGPPLPPAGNPDYPVPLYNSEVVKQLWRWTLCYRPLRGIFHFFLGAMD